jgi:hypothetical protein
MNLYGLLLEAGHGFRPDQVFDGTVSVDMAELLLVFGTIAISLVAMVIFGNWWSR